MYPDRPRKNLDDEKWLQKFKEAINVSTINFYLITNVHLTHYSPIWKFVNIFYFTLRQLQSRPIAV
jgi:hypothetical protein